MGLDRLWDGVGIPNISYMEQGMRDGKSRVYLGGRSRQSRVTGAENYSCDAVGNPSFRAVGFNS